MFPIKESHFSPIHIKHQRASRFAPWVIALVTRVIIAQRQSAQLFVGGRVPI
jgi:hypothetical protein